MFGELLKIIFGTENYILGPRILWILDLYPTFYEWFKDTLKAFENIKNKKKSVSSNICGCVKACIFWTCLQYTIHLKKISSDKRNGTKHKLFFLLPAPTHHSFTFNWRFLHELKNKVRLSKSVFVIFHFQFRFVFIKVYIFAQLNARTLKCHNSFQN